MESKVIDLPPVCKSEGSQPQFNLDDAIGALKVLSLNSVTFGDYLVVLNDHEDAMICGEPYLALQLWLNLKSGNEFEIWTEISAC